MRFAPVQPPCCDSASLVLLSPQRRPEGRNRRGETRLKGPEVLEPLTLIFLLGFPCFFRCKKCPCCLERFPFFYPRDLRGSEERKKSLLFWVVFLAFPKKCKDCDCTIQPQTPPPFQTSPPLKCRFRGRCLVVFARFRPILAKSRVKISPSQRGCSGCLAEWGRGSVAGSQVTMQGKGDQGRGLGIRPLVFSNSGSRQPRSRGPLDRTPQSAHHPHKSHDEHRQCNPGGGIHFAVLLGSDNSYTTPFEIPFFIQSSKARKP